MLFKATPFLIFSAIIASSFEFIPIKILFWISIIISIYIFSISYSLFNEVKKQFHLNVTRDIIDNLKNKPDQLYQGIMRNILDADPYQMEYDWQEKWTHAKVNYFKCAAFGKGADTWFMANISYDKDEKLYKQIYENIPGDILDKKIVELTPWRLSKKFITRANKIADKERSKLKNENV